MSTEFDFDESRWPLLVVTWPTAVSDDAARAAFERMASYVHRGERYCILHDGRRAPPLSARQRRIAADIGERDEHLSKTRVAGAALVFSSPLLRGAITAVNWLFPPPYPQKAFATLSEATAWCHVRLDDH